LLGKQPMLRDAQAYSAHVRRSLAIMSVPKGKGRRRRSRMALLLWLRLARNELHLRLVWRVGHRLARNKGRGHRARHVDDLHTTVATTAAVANAPHQQSDDQSENNQWHENQCDDCCGHFGRNLNLGICHFSLALAGLGKWSWRRWCKWENAA